MIFNNHDPEALFQLSEAYGISRHRLEQAVPLQKDAQVFRIENGHSPLLLKAHTILPAENAFILEHCIEVCSKIGVTPAVLPTREQKTLFRYRDIFYALMRYVPANHMASEARLESIAELIACMHQGMAVIKHENILAPLYLDPYTIRDNLYREGIYDYIPYLEKADEYRNQVRWQLVHNDLHAGNILTSDVGRTYVVDFESISANPLIADVCFGGFRLAGGFNSRFTRFLRHYDTLNPLTPDEKRYGLLFLAADFIKKIGFIITENISGNTYYMKDYRKYRMFCEQAIAALHTQEYLCALEST